MRALPAAAFAVVCAIGGCAALPITSIQGAGHESAYAGRAVTADGVVTAVESRGFYLQEESGDDDPATSDAIFVFTEKRPRVAAGDRVRVRASVQEYVPGGERTGNLSVTELIDPAVEVLGRAGELPEPLLIGRDGRRPPVSHIDDDALKRFEPAEDAIDFFESLEGMRVRVVQPVAVSALNRYGELFVLPDRGRSATGRNSRGGLTLTAGDPNPERVQIQLERTQVHRSKPDTGAVLEDVVGVVSYAYGNYEVRADGPFRFAPSRLERERTPSKRSPEHLTVATFNLHALALPHESATVDRFAVLARQIVAHLGSPDIIAAQEIEDDDGAVDSQVVDARRTAGLLIDAIEAAGGPPYRYADLPPRDDADGGPDGGNIRVGYLYDASRVTLIPGSLTRLLDMDPSGGDVFTASRKPLLAGFRFNGRRLFVVNVHLSSRRESTPLFGRVRPPVIGNAGRRTAQAALIAERVVRLARGEPEAAIIVAGDFNDFDFSKPMRMLAEAGGGLVDMVSMLPERERYTYVFDGNAQALDHILVSPALAANAEVDIVHVNAEFARQASDHDPVLVRLHMPR